MLLIGESSEYDEMIFVNIGMIILGWGQYWYQNHNLKSWSQMLYKYIGNSILGGIDTFL